MLFYFCSVDVVNRMEDYRSGRERTLNSGKMLQKTSNVKFLNNFVGLVSQTGDLLIWVCICSHLSCYVHLPLCINIFFLLEKRPQKIVNFIIPQPQGDLILNFNIVIFLHNHFSTTIDTRHPWVKRIQVCSMKGHVPALSRGDYNNFWPIYLCSCSLLQAC